MNNTTTFHKEFQELMPGTYRIDLDTGEITSADPKMAQILGYDTTEEILGEKISEVDGFELPELAKYLEACNKPLQVTVPFTSKNGKTVHVGGNVILYEGSLMGTAADYTEMITRSASLAQENERLAKSAHTDALTGLYNRNYFEERVNEELSRSERSGLPIGLIELDLDYFKTVNDTYGHIVGDLYLQDVADILIDTFRKTDLVFRLGGDEFVVLLPEIKGDEVDDEEKLSLVLRRLEEKIKEFNQDKKRLYDIELSYGYSISTIEDHKTREQLLSEADQKMYAMKREAHDSRGSSTDSW